MFYEPAAHIDAVAPTPLLLIVAKNDNLCPTDIAVAASSVPDIPRNS